MRIGYLPRAEEAERLDSEELRAAFIVDRLFVPGEMNLFCSDLDRLIVGGVMPAPSLRLPAYEQLGTSFFTQRRELGIINIGETGIVVLNGGRFRLRKLDCLYIGIGEADVCFEAEGSSRPAFYLLSCPAHQKYPTALVTPERAGTSEIGDHLHASKRRLTRYIHPGGLCSCQLVMGYTELEEGSVWNTVPPHTHSRRSEIYLYFDLGEDDLVMHFMGSPRRTRHLVVRDRQAVLSPPWSIHVGAGTRNYRFIWGMAGENQVFADTDPLAFQELR